MASPDLTKHLVANPGKIGQYTPNNFFQVDRSYLCSLQDLLESAVSLSAMNSLENIGVFEDIEAIGRQSIQVYHAAFSLIKFWPSWLQRVWDTLVYSVVPIYEFRKEDGRSFSDPNFVGGIFTSVDLRSLYPDLALNIVLAHEVGHQALMIYQHGSNLLDLASPWVYSGVRRTLRPAAAALHAAVALAYMIEAIEGLLKVETDIGRVAFLRAILNDYRDSLKKGVSAQEDLSKTQLGQWIFEDLSQMSRV
jgi:hypothetical protein